MRTSSSVSTLAALGLAFTAASLGAQDVNRSAEDGGIFVDGWMGQIDAREAAAGQTLENARLSSMGGVLHVTTGPAVTYWNPANRATGSYTVSATFHEPEYMNVNNHPHPYGIVIGGNHMGTDEATFLYCAAYGNGSFIMRGFGPGAFQLGGRRPTEHEAVNSAAGRLEPVTQEIAVTVTADEVSCAINGTTVASYPKSEVVMDGRLESTDGVYGIRFAHNTDAQVRNLRLSQN